MATASAAKAASETRTAKAAKTQQEVVVAGPSRREFLYYIWGASMALFLGQATAGLIWFAFPRFAEGEFGGTFTIDPAEVPPMGEPPISKPAGRFWLSNPQEGFLALYAVCTHLGCLPKWVATNNRFECPCHGSKFELDGAYIEGPAPRALDRFVTTITFTDGTSATSDEGQPIPLEGRTILEIRVNTGARILGPSNT